MADCGVCLYSDDCGESDLFSQRIRTSRKDRKCSECGMPIVRGQRYQWAQGRTEGEFWGYATCLICDEIAEAFFCNGRTYGGMLWEFMGEVWSELTTSCFDRLKTPEAKAELRRRWMKWKFSKVS